MRSTTSTVRWAIQTEVLLSQHQVNHPVRNAMDLDMKTMDFRNKLIKANVMQRWKEEVLRTSDPSPVVGLPSKLMSFKHAVPTRVGM